MTADSPAPAAELVAPEVADTAATRTFSTSILVSGVRCALTYIFFPIIAPLLGLASGVGPTVGIVIGIVAIAANVVSIRRFHRSSHPWRWWISSLNLTVIGLLLVLLVIDLAALFG